MVLNGSRGGAGGGGDDNASLILVMGITGAGKSYFINKVSGANLAGEGKSLNSCTEKATIIPATIGREKVVLIDTPGFDDTYRSDTDILTEISTILTCQYETGLKLKGVIFLHRITDIRMHGSSMKTLNICKKICGNAALKNVILVTTRWNEVDPSVGASRENELRNQFWKFMLNFGSTMMRYHGDEDSAVAIASQLINKSTIVLDIQRELVDEGKKLSQTTAGSFVNDNIEELKSKYEQELRDLEQLRRDLLDGDRQMREDIQKEWVKERERLHMAQQQQVQLQRPVGQEVREEIKNRRSGLSSMLPFLPTALGLLGSFVGIPPGTFELFSMWFADSSWVDTIADFIGSF